ncbi:hypothetical protein MSG28_009297 [Choristoneura fumiferana]|uniref:Uncharacterized protein n=1 Tax=Choristoneura fumiferana TaxID=7141 RepID=A0ACC0KXG0_CHOFU|nr:hypothetical protein MSG28_009297 [Choristoneura fumiferana]
MDSFMEYYFEEVFCNLERDCLNERYKRRELVEYFNTVIAGCAKGQNHSDNITCKNFILAALRYHNGCKSNNGDVCLMGKYHNLLYIAMKLSFDWSVQDNGVVAALLDELYACEKTFERIFLDKILFLPHCRYLRLRLLGSSTSILPCTARPSCGRVCACSSARSTISTGTDSFTDLGLHDKHI